MTQSISKKTPDPFISETAAAELTGMSIHWFRRARWAGNGPPFIKLGNAVRYRESTLIKWFEARTISSTSQASTK